MEAVLLVECKLVPDGGGEGGVHKVRESHVFISSPHPEASCSHSNHDGNAKIPRLYCTPAG